MNDFQLYVKVEELQKYGNQLLMHYRREQYQLHQSLLSKNVDISYTHYPLQKDEKHFVHHHSQYHRLPTPPLDSDHDIRPSTPSTLDSNHLVYC